MKIAEVFHWEPSKRGTRPRYVAAISVAVLLTAAWLFVGNLPDQGSVSASAPPSCVTPPPNMVSWFPGDGDANDIAGGNNGTMQGGAGFGAGEVAQGFALNGTDAGVSVPDAPSLNFGPGADFSIDAWVRSEVKQTPTSPGLDIQTIVDKRYTPDSSTARGYTLFLINGQVGFQLADENNYYNFPPAGPDLRDGQFHLVAVTVDRDDPSGGQVYIDGISVSTFDPTVRQGDLTNAQPLLIGIHSQTGLNGFFQGVIDEAEIFSRELSSAEVQAIYNAGSDGKCKPGADADGDGVPDANDNCPLTPNANQEDADGDGNGDVCDSDDDNDTVFDSSDNCPLTFNPSQANLDGDAFGDACDPDDDNDGVADGVDNCPTGSVGWTSNGASDYDHDGCRDSGEDTDDDGDGVADGGDSCPLGSLGWTSNSATDNDHDGCRDSGEDPDDDNDGDLDGADNCPLTANASQVDTDGDGSGDACDFDDDNDTVVDVSDNCPLTFNPSQANLDGDALGDGCDPDDDNDGDPDGADNCPLTPNSNQSDIDHDGIGDVCDPVNDLDLDGDGIPNVVDNCLLAFNPDQADTDGDGIGNACDTNANDGPLGDIDGDGVRNNSDNCPTTPNADQLDTNGDGVGDLCTPFQYASGGQFVIGNLVNMSSTANVYFWGSQWRQNNPMSGGSAPSAFKGFENGLALPACGSTWTSRPGNSSNPPPSVPTNVAVIVSSSITQSGSTISGNVKKIVVVRTNPGYGPAPGTPGTGKVIAVLCTAP